MHKVVKILNHERDTCISRSGDLASPSESTARATAKFGVKPIYNVHQNILRQSEILASVDTLFSNPTIRSYQVWYNQKALKSTQHDNDDIC